ncbi:MAG: hypothetical protein KJN63_07305 [Acidimicrobiia bacterium]|nr:hypothetical protein [Acidimicrobiia bacterium]
MKSYGSVTAARRLVVAVVLVVSAGAILFSTTVSDAQVGSVETAGFAAAAGNSTASLLERDLAEAEARIAVLEQQLALTRQSALLSEERVARQRDTILAMQLAANDFMSPLSVEYQEQAMDAWRAGYRVGGGKNLAAFENVILPCESGGEDDPFAAIGRTDDWGRAQINRPTWRVRFTELTGLGFEDWILDPTLNGYMAAMVEQEQGLRAWTCWRRR